MSALRKVGQLSKLHFKNPLFTYIAVRNHWNKDFKPGPYPVTLEQRVAAAKKYGMSPEEYEPYPDDGMGLGDYPKLPDVSDEQKDPFYPYDFPEMKRNFGEPLHLNADVYGEDRYDISARPRFTMKQQCMSFFGVMGVTIAVYYLLDYMPMFRPVIPKQYPQEGKKHYSFENAD